MKKAIVTGASGFIGKFLVRELLKQNVTVCAIVRPNSNNIKCISSNVKIYECSLESISHLPEIVLDRDVDAVFHTAWQGVSDSDARNQAVQLQNISSTLDLIDAMNKMGINTFVGCGSIHEQEALVEMDQDKVIDNLGFFYKTAKISAHWMGKAKAGKYGIRFFWPLINTYGEEERSARLVNSIIRKIYYGESPDLSDGKQFYDFVHVSDVARALYLIAEKGVDGTNYTIGSGETKPLREYLEIVGSVANEINGSSIPLGFGKRTENVVSLPASVFDSKKLTRDTGFIPEVSFEDGIRRTALWIYNDEFERENKHGYTLFKQ